MNTHTPAPINRRNRLVAALLLAAGTLAAPPLGADSTAAATPPQSPTPSVSVTKLSAPKSQSSLVLTLDIVMQPIPAGSFLMGSPANEPERGTDEKQHCVTITKPFWLGKFPVTIGQWNAVTGDETEERILRTGVRVPVSDDTPKTLVSWTEAMTFCAKLNEKARAAGELPDGYEYTLPTEAQWEYACRAGTTTPFSTGKNLTTSQGNYDSESPNNENGNKRGKQLLVGSFLPNAWGIYDMHGNVSEWCSDWFGEYPTDAVTDPAGTPTSTYQQRVAPIDPPMNTFSQPGNFGGRTRGGVQPPADYSRSTFVFAEHRIMRGGSWMATPRECRSAARQHQDIGYRSSYIGFRLALTPVENTTEQK